MINLNLLPEKEKKNLRKERIYQFIFISFFILLIGIVVISLELFLAKNVLKESLSIYTTSLSQEQGFIEKIKELNFKFAIIEEVQSNYWQVSPILIHLAEITPSASYLKSISLDREKKEFQIKGKVKTRRDLLELQGYLERSLFFKEIEAPLSNLLRQENIEFEFKGKLK
ncbi:MAG: PilN domain-containing protein [Patescibacteria group bacterium]